MSRVFRTDCGRIRRRMHLGVWSWEANNITFEALIGRKTRARRVVGGCYLPYHCMISIMN